VWPFLCKTLIGICVAISAAVLLRVPLSLAFQPTTMLIQKVFHIRQPVDEAQARLSDARSFSRRFWNLGRSGGWRGFWDAVSVIGLQGPFELELLHTDNKRQVLFHSTGGEMELCGLMELLPVRDRLTEVQLTLEYEMQSPLRRVLDRLLGVMNRRVNHHIVEMKRQMDDDGAPGAPARFESARFVPAPPSGIAGEPHPAR